MKKNILLILSLALVSLVGCGSDSSSFSSSESISSDSRTAKEKVMDVCEKIIEESKNETLVSTTQAFGGRLSISSMDSTTSIYQSTNVSLTNIVIDSSLENDEVNSKANSLYEIKGQIDVKHKEEYLGEEETDVEVNNFEESYFLNEKMMTFDNDLYLDLSNQFSSSFEENVITGSPDLLFKLEDGDTIIQELISEYYPEFDESSITIPEIDPHQILDDFLGQDSLFKNYLKYVEENNVLKLKLVLKPADFNELLNNIVLENDPESTVPISTIFQMDSGNIELVFNFINENISSLDLLINGSFNILANQYTLNSNIEGEILINEISSFSTLENYTSYPTFDSLGVDVKQEIKNILDELIPSLDNETIPSV